MAGSGGARRDSAASTVVYVLANVGYGGTEVHLRELVFGLDRQEFNPVVLVAGYGPSTVLAPQLREAGVTVEALPPVHGALDVRGLSELVRLIRRHHAALAHVHMPSPTRNLGTVVAASLARVDAVLSTEHSHAEGLQTIGGRKGRVVRAKVRARIRLQKRLIAVSAGQAATFGEVLGTPPQKITVIHNGIDPTRFSVDCKHSTVRDELGLSPSTPLVGMVTGYLDYERTEDFLAAAADVVQMVPTAHFLVIGDRHPNKVNERAATKQIDLARLAAGLAIGDRAHFLGFRSDMDAVMAALDVLVLPATFKSFGLVLLEAMASGKPVVATDRGGVPEIVRHGETGLLVPPLAPATLALAVVRLLQDRDLATRLGSNGRRRVEQHFTLDLMIRRTTQLYRSLLRGPHERATPVTDQ